MNLNIGLWNFILVMVHHKTLRIVCYKGEKKNLSEEFLWLEEGEIKFNTTENHVIGKVSLLVRSPWSAWNVATLAT